MANVGKRLLRANGLDRGLKIAVVKPDVHNDLYYRTSPASPSEIVYSSILRSGPVALFTALDAHYYVVKTDPNDEGANCWREKVSHCKHHSYERFEQFQGAINRYGRPFDHAAVSIDPHFVDWSRYDIVITFDCAVPAEVRKEHLSVVWCYYVSEGCMPIYRASHESPQHGYDLFLNLGLSHKKPNHAQHVIEFPYYLQYAGCFEDLDGIPNPAFESRDLISCERHTRKKLTPGDISTLSAFGELYDKDVTVSDLVGALRKSKYLLRMNAKPLWGNSLAEAMAVGAFVIASPETLKHRLMIDDLSADDIASASKLMDRLERNRQFRADCLSAQNERLNEVCFLRPLRDLFAAYDRLRSPKRRKRKWFSWLIEAATYQRV